MIERHDTVLPEYTDEHLAEWATRGHWQAVYANTMMSAPPEYRQGIAVRASELTHRTEYRNGLALSIPTGVSWDDAHRQALDELRAQLRAATT